ncbi:uncharacterized protein Z520_11800 [Fonsecaea multimorphosa CBS 102226]|uniref:Uncharacterized protein n=1 Tax=Fonsecaea multimorphosa CBS 102226 TaxID=1442371 RepID=A0A0D2GSP7_9EURO|nr:uncharacterized protein Z520_11800 [Fonsecaea multimorphosa CBS 102226]KIX92480.1 hypothetical protein Z520_11800 [Fonsecaea multimorphosa CBS 102226]OAL19595.1 hypothetical protein AYO22_09757 [Fonsecaea multimorphosa]
MSSLRKPAATQRSSYYSLEGSAFLEDYTPEIVRTGTLSQKVDGLFKRRKTSWQDLERRFERKSRPWNPLVAYLWNRRYPLRALLSITAAFLEVFLLLFLFCTYYTLPADPHTGGKPPRIADLYSTFPFMSCVGSKKLSVYQSVTFCVVLLGITSSTISFYFTRDDQLGWQTRRAGWLASVVGAGLSIWVVFAAANPDKHLHLLVTAVKAITVFCIKSTGLLVDHLERRKYPALREVGVIRVLLWWRAITLVFAFPLALMTNVAIFGCSGSKPADIQTPGTRCYWIMALGAPAEWLYALTTVSWSLAIAFDVYSTLIITKVKSQQDQAKIGLLTSPLTGQWGIHPHSPQGPAILVSPEEDESFHPAQSPLHGVGWKENRIRHYEDLDTKVMHVHGEHDVADEDEPEEDLGLAVQTRNWA